jgi:hypothetical protein
MAREHDPARVAAIAGGIVPRPADRAGSVIQEGGEAHLGVEPVIRKDRHEALGGERGPDELVFGPRSGLPRASVEEHQDGARSHRPAGRDVHVEPLPWMVAVGQVRGGELAARIAGRDRIEDLQRRT